MGKLSRRSASHLIVKAHKVKIRNYNYDYIFVRKSGYSIPAFILNLGGAVLLRNFKSMKR